MAWLKTSDHQAIAHFAKEHNLKMAMSTPPTIYFKDKKTGEEVKQQLDTIVGIYKGWKEEQARTNKKRKAAA